MASRRTTGEGESESEGEGEGEEVGVGALMALRAKTAAATMALRRSIFLGGLQGKMLIGTRLYKRMQRRK